MASGMRERLKGGLLGDSSYLLVPRAVGVGTNILIVPFFLAELGLEAYGIWAISTALLNYLALTDLGLKAGMVRLAADAKARGDRASIRRLAGYGASFYTAIACIAVVVIAVLGGPIIRALGVPSQLREATYLTLQLTIVRALLLQYGGIVTGLQMGLGSVRSAGLVAAGGHAAYGGMVMLALSFSLSLEGVALAAIVQGIPMVLFGTWIVRRQVRNIRTIAREPLYTGRSLRRELLRFGGWLQATNVASGINNQTDTFLMAFLFGPAAAGQYEVGNRLSLPGRLGSQSLAGAAYARMASRQANGDAASVDREASSLWHWTVALVVTASILITAIAPDLMNLWLGEVREGAVFVARVLVLSHAVGSLSAVASSRYRATGRPDIEAKVAMGGAGTNIVLSIVLGMAAGFKGVVVASAIATIGSAFIILGFYVRDFGVKVAPAGLRVSGFVLGMVCAGILAWVVAEIVGPAGQAGRVGSGAACVVATAAYSAAVLAAWRVAGLGKRAQLEGRRD